jgi:hypothetical protein
MTALLFLPILIALFAALTVIAADILTPRTGSSPVLRKRADPKQVRQQA